MIKYSWLCKRKIRKHQKQYKYCLGILLIILGLCVVIRHHQSRYTVGKLRQDPEYEVSLNKIVGLHLRKKKQKDEVEISEFFEDLVLSHDVFLETVL